MEVCKLTIMPNPIPHFRYLPSLPLLNFSHFPGVVSSRRPRVVRVSSSDDEQSGDTISALKDFPTIDDHFTPDSVTQTEHSQVSDMEESTQELFDNLGIQLDIQTLSQILLYSGGSLVAVLLLSAVVGAIDSIPVVPQLLEVVGLGYSLWFTTRYLLFKKNREELSAKLAELKNEVLGG